MPDILICCRSADELHEVESVCESIGSRYKSTPDPARAIEWMKVKKFDAIVLDSEFNTKEQKELIDVFWRENSTGLYIVVDPSDTHATQSGELRLRGAEIVSGQDASSMLKSLLLSLNSHPVSDDGTFRVLVVEDLDSPRDIICSYVEELCSGAVTGVGSADEALIALESEPEKFSCVITDIRMPAVSGRQLIERIRRHKKLQHLPVVVLTAYGTPDCLIDCLKAGASGFLVKPPKKNDLLREMGRAIRIKSHGISPRLASKEEAELLRDMLVSKGYVG